MKSTTSFVPYGGVPSDGSWFIVLFSLVHMHWFPAQSLLSWAMASCRQVL